MSLSISSPNGADGPGESRVDRSVGWLLLVVVLHDVDVN